MKSTTYILPAILMGAFVLLAGCSGNEDQKTFNALSDFAGATMGSQSGTAFAEFADNVIPNLNHQLFNSTPDQVIALTNGEVDAIILDKPVALSLVSQNPDFVIFPDLIADDRYGSAISKGSDLGVRGNEILQKMIKDGTIAELEKYWFSGNESEKTLPVLDYKADFDGSAGTIRYGCDPTLVPMCYINAGGNPVGFDLDIVNRIAYELNMNIEFISMSFDALLTSLESGRVEMVGGAMSITAERLKSVDFIGPVYEGGVVLVLKKDRLGS